MVASAILLIIALGTLSALDFSAQSSADSARRVTATNVANQQIEQIRNMPYDVIGVDGANPDGTIVTPVTVDDDYTVQTEVTWARDSSTLRALYKIVTVTVDWEEGLGGSFSVATNVYGKSSLVNTGDVALTILDRATGEPVEDAMVVLTASDGTPASVRTDENGEAFFGYLDTGDWSIDVTKSGYIYDSQALPGVTVAPDLLTTAVGYLQEPSRLEVHVQDQGGSVLSGVTVTAQRSGDTQVLTGTTGVGGAVEFDDLMVGQYSVSAALSGWSPASTVTMVSAPGEAVEVTLSLAEMQGLVVRVVDDNGVGMSGAEVSVRGPSPSTTQLPGSPMTTTSSGDASFGYPAVGTYMVTVSRSGYGTVIRTISYDGSLPYYEVSLSPEEYGSLEIHTVRSNGNNYGREWVIVVGEDFSQWVRTDSSGYATLTGLRTGSYTVTSYRSGRSYEVQVLADETALVTVVAQG